MHVTVLIIISANLVWNIAFKTTDLECAIPKTYSGSQSWDKFCFISGFQPQFSALLDMRNKLGNKYL